MFLWRSRKNINTFLLGEKKRLNGVMVYFLTMLMICSPADTFAMRQTQAAELKVKIDRADRLNDSQLADLRAEIKVSFFSVFRSLSGCLKLYLKY